MHLLGYKIAALQGTLLFLYCVLRTTLVICSRGHIWNHVLARKLVEAHMVELVTETDYFTRLKWHKDSKTLYTVFF